MYRLSVITFAAPVLVYVASSWGSVIAENEPPTSRPVVKSKVDGKPPAKARRLGRTDPIESVRQAMGLVTVGELRRHQSARPLLQMSDYPRARNAAQEILSTMTRGWKTINGQTISMTPPIDWQVSKDSSRSINFMLHSWKPLVTVTTELSVASDLAMLDFALAVALDWVENNPLPAHPRRNGGGAFAWYDMAVGLRVALLATLIDVACRKDEVPDEKISRLWQSLIDHFVYLEDDQRIAFHSNHGIYQAAGQFSAARRFNWHPTIRQVERQAETRLRRMLRDHFTNEGVHREHSPGYQIMVMRTFSRLHDAGLLASIDGFAEGIASMQDATAWMIQPDGHLVNFGDTGYTKLKVESLDADGWNSESLRFAASEGRTGSPPDTRIRGFPASGFVALRSGWPAPPHDASSASYLAMQCAFHSMVHKQADNLTIVWFDAGLPILVDVGSFGYVGKSKQNSPMWQDGFFYSDPNRIYVESTRAHNTIQIDDTNHQRRGARPYGSALRSWGESDGIQYAVGSVVHFNTINHRRIVLTRPHKWLLVVDDVADKSQAPHVFRQWFQMGPKVEYTETHDRAIEFRLGEQAEPLWSVPLESVMRSSVAVRGQTEPRMQGWWSPRHRVIEPIWSFNWRSKGIAVRMATLFSLGGPMPIPINVGLPSDHDRIEYAWRIGESHETLRIDMRGSEPKISFIDRVNSASSRPAG